VRSEVVLNGSRLGRGSETKLLCDGDVVSIESATDGPETSDRLVRAGVAIMHHSAELCVIYKPPGIGCADGSDLDFAIKNCVWPRTTPSDPERLLHEGRLLYAIGKNQGGILIAVSSPHVLEVACNAVMTGRLILRARCVVCGKIIDNAKSVVSVGVTEIGQLPQFCIFVDELPEVELVVTLVEVSPCRAVGELSVIDIVPRFRTTTAPDSRSGGSSFRPPGSIRSVMKHIKFIMSQAGHTIVGDFDMVKKDKGVYLSLYSLKNSDPSLSGFSEVLCAIPDKFAKLLEREKAFHSKAIAKGIKILQDGNACDPEVIRSLEAGYPPEYVAGCAEFLGRSFIVNDSVMIPRKSSAVLVEAAIRWASHSMDSLCRKITILDIGTGSGCLLLSCIAELQRLYPDVSVFGVGIDICPKALAVARENCQRMNLTKSVKFIEQNFDNLDSLAQSLNAGLDLPYSFDAGIFNIILCNPPYSVPYRDSRISRSRIMYEPGVALFGISSNMTGIEFSAEENGKKRKSECRDEFTSYRIISDSLRRCFERDSCHTGDCAPLFQESAAFFFEVGNGQSDRAAAILKTGSTGLTLRCLHSDFKGLPRCIELGYHRFV
jgi:HemK-like putative methylase